MKSITRSACIGELTGADTMCGFADFPEPWYQVDYQSMISFECLEASE